MDLAYREPAFGLGVARGTLFTALRGAAARARARCCCRAPRSWTGVGEC